MEGYQPDFIFPFAVNGLNLAVQIFVFLYLYKFSYTIRIVSFFLVATVIMIILPIVANNLEAGPGFAVCLVILLIYGVFGGIGQASVFAYSGMLPSKYMGAVMLGNGLSGILIGVMRAICLVIFPSIEDEFYGALTYYILAAIILVICAAL
jgi:nitrate/nitrite transporter NarK